MEPCAGRHCGANTLGGAALCLILVTTFLYSQTPPGSELSTIRVETQQVLVPVVVKDREGHYLRNLKAANFRIYDDGGEQKIVAFIAPAGGPSNYFQPQRIEEGLPIPQALSPPAQSKGPAPSTYLICVDTLNSAFSSYVHVRRALEKLFTDRPPSDSQYALLTLGRQPRVIRNLTRGPATILTGFGEFEFTHAIGQSETIRHGEEETQISAMLHQFCGNCDCASGRDPESEGKSKGISGGCAGDWQSIEAWAGAQAEQRRRLSLDFLNNLRGLVERLGQIPGRRTIIFVSDGFNIQPGRELYGLMAAYTRAPGVLLHNSVQDVEPEVELVVRAAQMRDVSFYTLDSRGVYSVAPVEINTPAVMAPYPSARRNTGSDLGPTLANLQSDRETVAKDNQSGLQELAAETGGDFFENSNDLLQGLRQAFDDGETYYLLAYTPTHLIADGHFHKIKVNVGPQNTVVRAKKGDFAPVAARGQDVAGAHPLTNEHPTPTVSMPASVSSGATPPPPLPGAGVSPQLESKIAAPPAKVNDSGRVSPMQPAQLLQPASVLMIDWPLARLMHVMPQLDGLRPVENQEPLPGILERVDKSVAAFAQNVTNLASKEEVLEEQLKSDGKVGKHFTEKFEYLVVAERGPGGVNLREYRTDENGKVVKPTGLTKGYMVTSGDFSAALCFLPILQNASSFRYLGEQDVDGRKAYVLVFAQRAGSAGPAGLLRSAGGEKSVTSVLQGIAWIDSDRYQIARLRTDQFPPASGASVWRLISDIHYHEVHFQEPASALWIPDKIVVTMSFTDRTWRDEHQYSNFKLFTVDTKVNSQQSRQPN